MRALGAPLMALALAGAVTAPRSAWRPPASDYVMHCAGCHRFDASGSARVPTLHGLDRVLAVAEGRAYLVRVPGVAQAPLSDARLAALLNWVVAEFSGRVLQPPFSGSEVGRLRAQPLRDPGRVRTRIAARMAHDG